MPRYIMDLSGHTQSLLDSRLLLDLEGGKSLKPEVRIDQIVDVKFFKQKLGMMLEDFLLSNREIVTGYQICL